MVQALVSHLNHKMTGQRLEEGSSNASCMSGGLLARVERTELMTEAPHMHGACDVGFLGFCPDAGLKHCRSLRNDQG